MPDVEILPNYNDPLTLAYGAIVQRELAITPAGSEEHVTLTWPHLVFMPVIQGTRAQAALSFTQALMRLPQQDLTVLMLQAPGLFIPVGVASSEEDYIMGVGAAEIRAKNAMRILERDKWDGTATPALKHHVQMLKVVAMLSHGGRTPAVKAVSERLLPVVCNPWVHDVLEGVWRHWETASDAANAAAPNPDPDPNAMMRMDA
jgi:hypothetical protein